MSLKLIFLKQILPPLILSIIFTAVISTTLIINYTFSSIDYSANLILKDEYSQMETVSDSIRIATEQNIRILQEGLDSLIKYSYIMDNLTPIQNNSVNFNNYLLNALTIAKRDIKIEELSDYNSEKLLCNNTAMWYINPTITNISLLSNQTKLNLKIAMNLDIFIRSSFLSNENIYTIYMFFENDGFQYIFPASQDSGFLHFVSDDICEYTNSGKTDYFDMRCRPYAKEIKQNIKTEMLNQTNMISKPYQYAHKDSFALTICSYYLEGTNITHPIPKNVKDRKLKFAICLDFNLDKMNPLFSTLVELKKNHFFIISGDLTVFYHPFFYFKSKRDYKDFDSITEYEFKINDEINDKEAIEFNKTIKLALNNLNNKSYDGDHDVEFSFFVEGKEYISTIMNINISNGDPLDSSSNLYVVLVQPKFLIMEPLDNLKENIGHFIISQIIIFVILIFFLIIIALILINYMVKLIITPLNDLCVGVKKILNDDLEQEFSSNYTPSSEELNELYKTFSKLKNLLKYGNDQFFSGNDAQALINYSNALKLYEEINHREAIGITYNNIGNIHLKNERYEESIINYRLAVNIVEEDLNKIYKMNTFRQSLYFRVKPANDNEQAFPETKKVFLTRSRRNRENQNLKKSEFFSEDKIKATNELYSNRLYQLATTMYFQALKENKDENWSEILYFFQKIIEIDSKIEITHARIIQSLIYIANIYLELGNHVAGLKYLHEAENSISLYVKLEQTIKNLKERSINSIELNEIQEKITVKADILKQTLMYYYGLFYKKIGKFYQACKIFTKSLETGKIYDPLIRRKCLESLSGIMANQNLLLKAPNITFILHKMGANIQKNIVFLLDYSESMKGARIKYAIRNILTIFDKYLLNNDRISFIKFNLNPEVIFNLTEKQNNTLQLRVHIEKSLFPSGKTALFDGLNSAINQFINNSYIENNKWIVCLTDGEDNSSDIDLKELENNLKIHNINLIIIAMALKEDLILTLSGLCKSTKEGVFIKSSNNNDLDIAFNAISQIVFGKSLIVEALN